jgi:hypothetical protein
MYKYSFFFVLCQRLMYSSSSRICLVEISYAAVSGTIRNSYRSWRYYNTRTCCVAAKQRKTEVEYAQPKRRPLLYDRIRLQSRCGHAFISKPLLAPGQMSPYVVPDHVLERKLPTSLTPTFWGTLTIVPFDSLDTDSPKSSVIPENHLVAQLSTSSKGSENTITPFSKSVDLPAIPHPRLYFDDGSITFRVRLCASRSWYLLDLAIST